MPARSPIGSVNDFAVRFANVNGSGSASANELFARSVLRMGVPVSARNIFPSNIQGLPTWYEIRVNRDGRTARALDYDLSVAMNAQTYARDIKEVRSGGYLLYDSTWPLPKELWRDDVTFLAMPFAELADGLGDVRVANAVMLGALLTITGILSAESIDGALQRKVKSDRWLELNRRAVACGREGAQKRRM